MDTSQLQKCFLGFFLGDAFGAPYDLKTPKTMDKLKFCETDPTAEWTENGDIAISILCNRGIKVVENIHNYIAGGIPDIERKAGGDLLSTSAKKVLTDDNWAATPVEVANAFAHKGEHALFNLPVTTSIAIFGADLGSVQSYCKLFVADNLPGIVACVYLQSIDILTKVRHQLGNVDCETIIRNTMKNVNASEKLTDDAVDYSRSKLTDLSLRKQPMHALNSLKVICYALRVVDYAQKNNSVPDLMKILRFIASMGGDVSSNCALASSLICAAKYHADIGIKDHLKHLKHEQWLTDRVHKLFHA